MIIKKFKAIFFISFLYSGLSKLNLNLQTPQPTLSLLLKNQLSNKNQKYRNKRQTKKTPIKYQRNKETKQNPGK